MSKENIAMIEIRTVYIPRKLDTFVATINPIGFSYDQLKAPTPEERATMLRRILEQRHPKRNQI